MLDHMVYIWIGVLVVSVIVEAATAGLVSIWFIPSAVVAAILAFCGVSVWIQVVVFFVLSLILLILSKTLFSRFFKSSDSVRTNADSLIGKHVVVTEKISNLAETGEVRVNGQRWSARSTEESVCFDVDEVLTVVAIEGVKLICRKEEIAK